MTLNKTRKKVRHQVDFACRHAIDTWHQINEQTRHFNNSIRLQIWEKTHNPVYRCIADWLAALREQR